MKTYAIGDIHGCYKTLINLLDELPDWDRLVFLGDYIDRGPDSKSVIDYLLYLQEFHGTDKVITLKGNHEDMCLHNYAMYKNNDFSLGRAWAINGAKQTIDSFESNDKREVPTEYLEWMLELPITYEDENAYYVHAGFYPPAPADSQIDYDMMWIRNEFLISTFDWGKPVIHGHTPFKKPQITDNRISIDTGCCFGLDLTAYCVETKEIIQVPCIDEVEKLL